MSTLQESSIEYCVYKVIHIEKRSKGSATDKQYTALNTFHGCYERSELIDRRETRQDRVLEG